MARSSHQTLSAATATPVALDQPYGLVTVINRQASPTATNEVYFTVDGSTPTVGGAGTYVVPGVYGASLTVSAPTGGLGVQAGGSSYKGTTVRLIATGATAVSVIGLS